MDRKINSGSALTNSEARHLMDLMTALLNISNEQAATCIEMAHKSHEQASAAHEQTNDAVNTLHQMTHELGMMRLIYEPPANDAPI